MSEPDPTERPPRQKLNAANLEGAIDKQIREAMERGDFDNLRGTGKPLNLARDPNVPEDWELAFNLLKNAGYAPDWIETLKQIRAEEEKIRVPFEHFLKSPPGKQEEALRRQTMLIEDFRAQAAALNRTIDTYNLKAPSMQVHLRRIRIDFEIEKFLNEVKQKS